MYELDTGSYRKVTHLFENVPINTWFAQAVINGVANGQVFVDNLLNPEVVYIIHNYGMSLILGDSTNTGFNQFLIEYWSKARRSHNEFLQAYPESWDKIIPTLLTNDLLIEGVDSAEKIIQAKNVLHTRVNFSFNPKKYSQLRTKVNLDDYDIREFGIDDFANYSGSVVPNLFWRDADTFRKNGKAYAVYVKGELASVAFSSCQNDEILELGIETNPDFRGCGLAKIACIRLIDYALDCGLTPIWACRKGNLGSYKLAESIGFVVDCELAYYQLKM
ncbi:GNAT family N-acetyltransferase [Aquella oligotrophica]|uniref:GNAT family N-acetyltransferase n=1 Tax=Aquella oligotrophica TaxID=2067065 RepID=A0A2I7N5X3_9NEIS|nr:GNAT family N-acetyltransferase [Aquella oligotrophica]AUR51849.1 GNAT family N-acetyltransferase [Aquella oligotrophica]